MDASSINVSVGVGVGVGVSASASASVSARTSAIRDICNENMFLYPWLGGALMAHLGGRSLKRGGSGLEWGVGGLGGDIWIDT